MINQDTGLSSAIRAGISGTFLNQSLKLLISLVSLPILARYLAPSDFGVFSVIFAIYLVFDLLRDLGLSVYALAERDLTNSERNGFFWVSVLSAAFFFILSLGMYYLIIFFLGIPNEVDKVIILNLCLIINGVSSQFLLDLRLKLKFHKVVLAEMGGSSLSALVAILIALLNGGIWALVFQQLVYALVSAAIVVIASDFRPALFSITRFHYKKIRISLLMSASQVIDMLSRSLVTLQLGREISLTEMGYFDRAQQLQNIPNTSLINPIRNMSLPILRMHFEDKRVIEDKLLKWQFIVLNIALFTYSILLVNSTPIIELIYGKNYLDSVAMFQVLLLIGMVQSVSHIAIWVILLSKISRLSLRLSLVNLFLVFAFVQLGLIFGLYEALIGLLIVNTLKTLLLFKTAHAVSSLNMRRIQIQGLSLLFSYIIFSYLSKVVSISIFQNVGSLSAFALNLILLISFSGSVLFLSHLFPASGRNDLFALIVTLKYRIKK